MVVWKVTLSIGKLDQIRSLPEGAKVLTAQMQAGVPTLWVLCEPLRTAENRFFDVLGTGWDGIGPNHKYISTVQDGPFVWHVFEHATGARGR